MEENGDLFEGEIKVPVKANDEIRLKTKRKHQKLRK